MEIVSPAGFPVAAIRWRTVAGHAYATLLCKATFALEPVRSPLASTQEPFGTRSSAEGSTAHPATTADGTPFKPRAEVILVGSAYAPAPMPASRVVARIVVGDVDKALVVIADRHRTDDGQIIDGARFKRMPIGWERAAGGPDTWNPIGVGDHLRDPRGRTPLPNVLEAGHEDDATPKGLGPIPAEWTPRRQHAGHGAIGRDGELLVLPDDLDPLYFQSAPVDQQSASAFDADTRLVLENLHPEHARFVTNLAPLFAVATVETAYRRETRALLADTLWIDTDASRCWLLFRTVVPLAADETARVRIDTAARYDELEEASTSTSPRPAMPSLLAGDDGRVPRAEERHMTAEIALDRDVTHTSLEIVDEPSHLPFRNQAMPPARASSPGGGAAEAVGPPSQRARMASSPGLSPPPAPPLSPPLNPQLVPPLSPPLTPPGSAPSSSPGAPPPPSPPRATPPVPLRAGPAAVADPGSKTGTAQLPTMPIAPPSVVLGGTAPAGPITGVSSATAWGTQKPAGAPSAVEAVRPEMATAAAGTPAVRLVGKAPDDVLAASNRAAATDVGGGRSARGSEARIAREGARDMEAGQARPARATDPLDLLWCDAAAADRLREQPSFRDLFGARESRSAFDRPTADEPERRRRSDVLRVLSAAPVTEPAGFEAVHASAVDRAGGVRPPMIVAHGDLVLRFDDREHLRAVIGVAGPFGSLDRSVKDAIDFATLVVDSEWSGPTSIEGAGHRVREALARASRELGAQALDATVQRKLLEKRRFRTATLLGREWFRTDLVAEGNRPPVPLYIPADLRDDLPLFERLPVRVIAELRRKQDGAESHPDALFATALARRLAAR